MGGGGGGGGGTGMFCPRRHLLSLGPAACVFFSAFCRAAYDLNAAADHHHEASTQTQRNTSLGPLLRA